MAKFARLTPGGGGEYNGIVKPDNRESIAKPCGWVKLVPYAEGLNEEKSAKMNRPRAEKGLISRPQEEVNLIF